MFESSAQRGNFDIPEIFTGNDDVVLQNGCLNVVQVVVKQNFLVSFQGFAECFDFFLFDELVCENFLQNSVIGDIFSSFILDQLTAQEIFLSTGFRENTGVYSLGEHFLDVLSLERAISDVASLVVPVGGEHELSIEIEKLATAVVVLDQQKRCFDLSSFFVAFSEHLFSADKLLKLEHACDGIE